MLPLDHKNLSGVRQKPVPRIAVLHHEACRMMTNGGPEGQIFLSYTDGL